MSKLQDLKNKLKELQDELESKDNNPYESTRIRHQINVLTREIEKEEDRQPVSVERGKELFRQMRQQLDLEEVVKYRQFFDL